jgi:hypothetical protein
MAAVVEEFRERYAALALASPALVIDHNATDTVEHMDVTEPEQSEGVVNGDTLNDDGEAS